MASACNQVVLQCSACREELDSYSKTLPCLHSFCRSCLDSHFEVQANGNGQCLECHEPLTLDELSLSPFLTKSSKSRQLKLDDWKCNLCLEDGIESTPRNGCYACQKLFCDTCSRFHQKLHPKHKAMALDGIEGAEVIKAMVKDVCSLHQKAKDVYCMQCKAYLCDTCYQMHTDSDSSGCTFPPLPMREEILKLKSQGPTLAKDMEYLEASLRRLNKRTRNYSKELNSECDTKCKQLWDNLVEMMENAKRKTNELCEEIRQMKDKQVKRWRHLLNENEKILKQLKIWRINLQHFLNESQQDVDVACGLWSLGSKLSSQIYKSVGLEEKYQLRVTFPNWWLQAMEQLQIEKIGLVSLNVQSLDAAKKMVFDSQWNLRRLDSYISSIHVTKEDDHVFLCDFSNNSIIEYTEVAEFVDELILSEGTKKFVPIDMCSISPNILIVACGIENKLILLERRKIHPFLEIKNTINTEKQFYSVCKINGLCFACDVYLKIDVFQVDSFTKEGKIIQTIKTIEIRESINGYRPLIRADPSTGNFFVTRYNSLEIFCINPNGEKVRSFKTAEKISDFCANEFGHLRFCNLGGIFSFSTEKALYKFEKKSENDPRIFVLKNKVFVCLQINGKYSIKIFKILD